MGTITDDELYKMADEEWTKANTWNLSRDDLIRISYFHGCMEQGSDGKGPINGSEDRPGDVVYVSPHGSSMTRHTCSFLFAKSGPFMSGFVRGYRAALNRAGN